jgi:hypothetical protein
MNQAWIASSALSLDSFISPVLHRYRDRQPGDCLHRSRRACAAHRCGRLLPVICTAKDQHKESLTSCSLRQNLQGRRHLWCTKGISIPDLFLQQKSSEFSRFEHTTSIIDLSGKTAGLHGWWQLLRPPSGYLPRAGPYPLLELTPEYPAANWR